MGARPHHSTDKGGGARSNLASETIKFNTDLCTDVGEEPTITGWAEHVEHCDEEPFEKVSEATVENVASPRFLSILATDRRVRSVRGLLVEVVLVDC